MSSSRSSGNSTGVKSRPSDLEDLFEVIIRMRKIPFIVNMEEYQKNEFYTVKSDDLKIVTSEVRRQKELRVRLLKNSSEKYLNSQQRTWLKKQGKRHYIDFQDNMRKDLHKYFSSIPEKGRKTIRADHLNEPLLALGLVKNRLEVEKLVDSVDSEKTGDLDFEKFLKLLKIGEGNAPKIDLSRELNRMKAVKDSDILPFSLVVSSYLRKMLTQYLMSPDPADRARGEKLLKDYIKVIGVAPKPRRYD
jgi:hypothetical protein